MFGFKKKCLCLSYKTALQFSSSNICKNVNFKIVFNSYFCRGGATWCNLGIFKKVIYCLMYTV